MYLRKCGPTSRVFIFLQMVGRIFVSFLYKVALWIPIHHFSSRYTNIRGRTFWSLRNKYPGHIHKNDLCGLRSLWSWWRRRRRTTRTRVTTTSRRPSRSSIGITMGKKKWDFSDKVNFILGASVFARCSFALITKMWTLPWCSCTKNDTLLSWS